jgi:hypothetical protein
MELKGKMLTFIANNAFVKILGLFLSVYKDAGPAGIRSLDEEYLSKTNRSRR